jgi:hypothetical protein
LTPQIAYGLELVRLALLYNRMPHTNDRSGKAEDCVKHSPIRQDDEGVFLCLRKSDGAMSVDFKANPFEPGDDFFVFEWPPSAHAKLTMIGRLQDMANGKEPVASIRF